jgi:tetraacyldisaccharide 4'-kinase
LFDLKILKSSQFNFPILSIGNLALGGTGKTPMTEWLISHLKNDYKIATLSRGYKRRTKGFALANEKSTALEIGDEPMQFYQKFQDITVAVGEERLVAIPQILYQKPNTELIILDDAMQHRRVDPGYTVMLTEYDNLYTRDLIFPCGDLRDIRSSAKRANCIIVTKCPADLKMEDSIRISEEVKSHEKQTVYFTTINYGTPYHLVDGTKIEINTNDSILLACGIANPVALKFYLERKVQFYEMSQYRDHHIYTSSDLQELLKKFEIFSVNKTAKLILTTEKDAVRLTKFKEELAGIPIYVIPIAHEFLFHQENAFLEQISAFIRQFEPRGNQNSIVQD